jgi:hypothetical protein
MKMNKFETLLDTMGYYAPMLEYPEWRKRELEWDALVDQARHDLDTEEKAERRKLRKPKPLTSTKKVQREWFGNMFSHRRVY